MPISLDCNTKILKAKALSSPIFERDRDKLAKISGRVPRYGINEVSGRDEFLNWEFPISSLPEILDKWSDIEIRSTDAVKKLIERYSLKFKPIDELEREQLKVSPFDGKILNKYQVNYITSSFNKTSLLAYFSTGCGKSLASTLRAANIGFTNLLICGPKKLRFNWRSEVRESLGRELMIYSGTKIQREKLQGQISNFNIFFVNFEMLSEFSKFMPAMDHIIVDEIHTVSSETTLNNKALYKILRSCQGHVQGLSATPMKLKIEDLWGTLRLLDAEFAGSKRAFLDEYQQVLATMKINKGGRTFYVPIRVTSKNEDKLREKLKGIMISVNKRDIVNFSDSIDIITTELTVRQTSMYNQAVDDLRIELADKTLDTSHALARLTRLLQISETCANLDDRYKDSGKLEFLKEDIKSKGDEKLIFWSRFLPIAQDIKALNPDKTVIYNGSVSDGLKDLAVWAFQGVNNKQDEEEFYRIRKRHPDFKFEPGEAQYFCGTHSLKSGLGINLHKSHICYFTSFDWNPQAVFQARDRISRIGQTQDTETYFLVSDNTIERAALKLILTNYEQSQNMLQGRGSTDSSLTRNLIKLLYKD